jgi:hypothetical protein
LEEQQPAFVLGEVDLDVSVGHLPGMDAVVPDIAHEAGELAQRVGFPPAVAGQFVPQRGGDRALELGGAVPVDERVNLGCCKTAGAARRRTRRPRRRHRAGWGRQEHPAPVGLVRLAEAALGPRVKPKGGQVGNEDVRLHAPQVLPPQAVRQPDYI